MGKQTALEVYIQERGASVDSGNSQTWDGKVGLIYTSDYMYAAVVAILII